jgi:D-beta-D-heptose 7-phosphate kinase/D-beta-D-heptose 1-phosphate adenosyltransferase
VGKRGVATVSWTDLLIALPWSAGEDDQPHKICAKSRASELAALWRSEGATVGFTNGCFDLLHQGHLHLLDGCRRRCDRLIVGMNSDASVRRIKGHMRPAQHETLRAAGLAAQSAVDAVVLFEEPDPSVLIEAIAPDILFKGADYRLDQVIGSDIVRSRGGRVELIPLLPGHSTSLQLQRLAVDALA